MIKSSINSDVHKSISSIIICVSYKQDLKSSFTLSIKFYVSIKTRFGFKIF